MSAESPALPIVTHPVMRPPDGKSLPWSGPAEFTQTPACRAEINLSPASIKAFGDVMAHLPALGMFVVLLALAILILRTGRIFSGYLKRSRDTGDIKNGTAVTVPMYASFGSLEMAAQAAEHQNAYYWQYLLSAFSHALEEEGYALRRVEGEKVVLPGGVRDRVGAAIMRAREQYLAPFRNEEGREHILLQAAEDGYTARWADWCSQGAESAGWYVVRRERKTGSA